MNQRLVLLKSRLVNLVGVALLISLLGPIPSPLSSTPKANAAAANACSASVAARNGVQVIPSHGNAFYIDSGQNQNIDASYVGYRIYVSSGAAIKSGLWVSLENFTGGSVNLANPLDGQQVLKNFAGNDTQTAFFLLKATRPTTAAQGHTVRIYSAPPSSATVSDLVYECQYTFTRVRETIKASPNTVSSVTVGTVPSLGETFTVTVNGNTGVVGAGGSPDFDAMWLSPAPRSSFPTRAMKLVGTKVVYSISGGSSDVNLTTFTDQLLVSNLRTKLAAIKNNAKRADYTATYTFQVIGKTSSAVKLLPVAQIASGQQMKHTDVTSLSSISSNVDLTTVDYSKVTIAKTQDSATSTGATVGSYIRVPYLVTVQNSGSNAVTIDKVLDIPTTQVLFDSNSATTVRIFTGVASYTQSTILGSSTSSTGQLTVPGPFTLGAGRKAEIRYSMLLPICASGSEVFDNTARAYIGDAVVGSSTAGYVPKTTVTQTCGSATITSTDGNEALPVEVQTYPATDVDNTSATLNGLVDSNGNASQSIYFDWGTSPGSLTNTFAPSNASTTTSATDPVAITKSLTGLSSGTIYYFRARVGSVVGQTLSFVTTEPVGPVTLSTDSATSVSNTSPFAVLNGTIDPNGNTTYVSYSVSTSSDLSTGVRTVMLTEDPSADLQTTVAQESTYNDFLVVSGSFPQQISVNFSDFTRTRSSAEETGVDISPTVNTTYYFRFNYHSSTSVGSITSSGSIKSFTVKSMLNQTITFPDIPDRTFTPGISDSFTLTTETSSANLTLTYTSEDPSVCTVDGFRIIILKAGTCILTASQPGNSSYNPADPVTNSFVISRVGQSITLADSSVVVGNSITLAATGGSGTGSIFYTSDSSRCSISGQTLTGNSVGSCVVTAVKEADDNYLEARTTAIIDVRNLPTAVTDDVSSDSVTTTSAELVGSFTPNVDSPDTAAVFVIYGTDATLTTNSSASVTTPGSGAGSGNAALRVVSSATGLTHGTKYYYRVRAVRGGDTGNGVIKSFITRPDTPTGVSVTPASNSASVAFTPVAAGSGVTITYTVTCTSSGGASQSATGSSSPISVTGLSSATTYTCTVRANSTTAGSGGGGFGGLVQSASFNTGAPKIDRVVKIFAQTSTDSESRTVTITYGETLTLWAAFESSTARWQRLGGDSGSGVGDGVLTFARESGSGCSISQVATSETATVSFSSVTGTPCVFKVTIGENSVYSETTSALTVSVTVTPKGLVATGSSHVLSYGDPVPALSASVTGFITGENSGNAAGYSAPTCTTNYTNTTNAGTGSLTVTCSSGAATNYTFTYVAGSVTVNPAAQVVTLAALSNMTVGDANQSLTTTNDKSRSVDLLTTADGAICDIVASAVRAKAEGSCTVSAQSSASGDGNFSISNTATRTFSITTAGGGGNNGGGNSGGGGNAGPSRLNPTITWNDPNDIFNPTPLGATQLNAVGSVPGTLVYAPALGTVLAVGRHTLSVTLNPTDATTYNSISTTVQIRVLELRFQTVLTWSNPASIAYPTPLSRTQLNARANTPGTFTYDPAIGTVLNPGTHILKVDFQPNLSRTYQPASTQVTIVVTTSGGNIPITPTPQQPIVVETRPVTTPSNPNQGSGGTGGNPGNATPPGQSKPVILIDTTTVNSVAVTDKGRGVTDAQLKNDRIEVSTAPTFSGKTSVEVTYVQNNETKVVVVPLVIPPAPPVTAGSSPQSMERSTIQWAASPNAISYDVYVRESLECQVRTTSCEVPFIVGPATPIRVVAIGGDETRAEVAPVFKQDRVIPALTVNFATASSRLSAAFRQELREIAEIIEREGFTSLIVYGHTDSRSYDNRTLSRQRAEATRDFLKRLLPDVEFKIAGFAATQRVAAENTRAGLAQNRRAEVRIAG